jgi:hypothetical protein
MKRGHAHRALKVSSSLILGLVTIAGTGMRDDTDSGTAAVGRERTSTHSTATPISFNTSTKCGTTNIVYAGRTMRGQFKGDWADWIKSVSVTPGRMVVSATLSNPVGNWSSSSMDVVLSATTDASLEIEQVERHTITIVVEPPFQAKFERLFTIDVYPPPVLFRASAPVYESFKTIQVKLAGAHLTGTNKVVATVKVDGSNPLKSYAYEPLQISNGSSIPVSMVGYPTPMGEVEVQLRFPQKMTKASVNIGLSSDGSLKCSPFGSGAGTGPAPTVTRLVPIASTYPDLAFVKSIDVTNAKLGRVAEFTITLGESRRNEMFVYWKMNPANVFRHVAGDIGYDPNATIHRTTINAGQLTRRFKLEVISLPTGATDLGGTAAIHTWAHNSGTTTEPPYFFQKAFTVSR